MSREQRPPRRDLAAKLALAAASTLLTLVALELAVRWLEPDQPPGTTYGRPVVWNSDGLREREVARPKPPGARRVVVLGDSFTWGVGLDVEDALPRLLERRLEAAGTAAEVINAAHPGHNTVEQLERLRDVGLGYRPDVVLVVYNLNDIEYLPEHDPNRGGDDARQAVPVVEIDPGEDVTRFSRRRGLRGALLALERRSALVRFLVPQGGALLRRLGLLDSVEVSWVEKIYQGFTDSNPGWRESKRALGEIAALGREHGFRVIVAVYPLFAELDDYGGEDAHRAVLDFCRENGIRAVDLLPLFEGTRARDHWIHFMDSHPDAAAHRRVADALAPVILRALEETR